MVLEIIGAFLVLIVWSLEMNENLKKKTENSHYKFMIFYTIGFLILSYYSSTINNIVMVFFFGLMSLISLIEFAFSMVKRKFM